MTTFKRQKRNDVAFAVASEKFGCDFVKSTLEKNATLESQFNSGMHPGCGCGCGGDSYEPLTDKEWEVIKLFQGAKTVPH